MYKSKGFEDYDAAAVGHPERSGMDSHGAASVATPVSCVGAGMTIIGNVACSGPAQVFGRIEGELRATELVIGEGAQVEGSIQAQDVTISGRVKGTVRAIGVKLQKANVEGDIFHRTLSIDESSVFEGMSRRVEHPVERPANTTADSPNSTGKGAKKAVQGPPDIASAEPDANGALDV
jgi:cytoskeletal protein CcmA (bactofilin family)